nr:hypothetical protein [Kibdelosporangium sp. MJ126-NF4]CTQ88845.1 hypothetical protein [Kibdelosporangium sp. MJ126-NF4]
MRRACSGVFWPVLVVGLASGVVVGFRVNGARTGPSWVHCRRHDCRVVWCCRSATTPTGVSTIG